jgi:hypothetical protein
MMKPILFNIFLGFIPTFALAWSMAADESKPVAERVVASNADRVKQRTIFLLVYGLWAVSLAMWNWMRTYPTGWIAFWALAGIIALGMSTQRRARL